MLIRGSWFSVDERGQTLIFGPTGWRPTPWPAVPLTRLERRLGLVAIVLVALSFVLWLTPSVLRSDCHSAAVCGAQLTATNVAGLLALACSFCLTLVLLVHHGNVKGRALTPEQDPRA